MNRFPFEDVVADYCRLTGRSDPNRIIDGKPIAFAGLVFALRHHRDGNGDDRLVLTCDLGPVPEGDRPAVYRAMLNRNLAVGRYPQLVLAVQPETGRATLVRVMKLESTTAQLLDSHLLVMSTHARCLIDALLRKPHAPARPPVRNTGGQALHAGLRA